MVRSMQIDVAGDASRAREHESRRIHASDADQQACTVPASNPLLLSVHALLENYSFRSDLLISVRESKV
jgi:hypothetical protein